MKKIYPKILAIGLLIFVVGVHSKEYVVSYAYNDWGLLTTINYPSGNAATNYYSTTGRFKSAEMHGDNLNIAKTSVQSYNSLGNLEKMVYHADRAPVLYYAYDVLGRLHYLAFSRESAVAQREMLYRIHGIKYNSYGFKSSFQRNDVSFNETYKYTYTPQGQLQSFQLGNQKRNYQFDRTGNMLHASAFTVQGINIEVPSIANSFDETTNHLSGYIYNDQGRVIRDRDYLYEYYFNGQIKAVKNKSTGEWIEFYVYDSEGSRLLITRHQEATYKVEDIKGRGLAFYTYDPFGEELLSEEYMNVAHGQVYRAQFDSHGTQILGEFRAHDERGNPVVVVDQETGSVDFNEYMPFGEPLYLDQDLQQSEGFAQMEEDQTGLIYMGARHFNKMEKRFNTPDPARDYKYSMPSSINLYQYARNNPIALHDPTGLAAIPNDNLESDGDNNKSLEQQQMELDAKNKKSNEILLDALDPNGNNIVITFVGKEKARTVNYDMKTDRQNHDNTVDAVAGVVSTLPRGGDVVAGAAPIFKMKGSTVEPQEGESVLLHFTKSNDKGHFDVTASLVRNRSSKDDSGGIYTTKSPIEMTNSQIDDLKNGNTELIGNIFEESTDFRQIPVMGSDSKQMSDENYLKIAAKLSRASHEKAVRKD